MLRDIHRFPAKLEPHAHELRCTLEESLPRSREWSCRSAKNVWLATGSSSSRKASGRGGLRTSAPATFRCSPKGWWATGRDVLSGGTRACALGPHPLTVTAELPAEPEADP